MKLTDNRGNGVAIAIALLMGMIVLGLITIAIMTFLSEFII